MINPFVVSSHGKLIAKSNFGLIWKLTHAMKKAGWQYVSSKGWMTNESKKI